MRRPRRPYGPLLLTILLASAALACFVGPLHGRTAVAAGLLSWWLLAVIFAATEVLVVHLPSTRSALTVTFYEVPTIIALAGLAPREHLLAVLAGSGAALVLHSRQRGTKLAFNLSLHAFVVAATILVYGAVLAGGDPASPRGWVAALVAATLAHVLDAVIIAAVIALSGDGFDRRVAAECVRSGLPASIANSSLAILMVVLLVREPLGVVLLGVVVSVLYFGHRAYVRLANRYAGLNLLYGFVGAVGPAGSAGSVAELDATIARMLTEASRLLGAERAELYLGSPHGAPDQDVYVVIAEARSVAFPGEPRAQWWWQEVYGRGNPVLRERPPKERETAGLPAGMRDAMAVPLTSGGRRGVLVVANRLFAGETFTREELRLLEALAAHAAITVENARLVDGVRHEAAVRDHESRHDPLTGLPNGRELQNRIDALPDGACAVLAIDLCQFKEINDTLGHAPGDEVLRQVGVRLEQAAVGPVARLGADEYAVLLPGPVTETEALLRAADLLDLLRVPLHVAGVTLAVTADVGIALTSQHGTDGATALVRADVAMHAAKANGVPIAVYCPDGDTARRRRLVLAGDLPRALEAGEVEVWFQPKADARTGQIVATEALVRWRHGEHGMVSPEELIAVAERTGLMRTTTDYVMALALRQRAAWAAEGRDLSVAVNVTTLDLLDGELPLAVERMLAATGTPAGRLTVEITESGVMRDPERCTAVLRRLHAMGVQLSVDDFGTGHSSLAYLEHLPVHEVKIDRSFVQRLAAGAGDATVIRATIQLGHALGLRVVAEGVESVGVWRQLLDMGCDVVQGYHVGRPTPAADLPVGTAALPSGESLQR